MRAPARLAFAAALLICHAAPARADAPQTPEQVADLYLASFVNADLASTQILNDYLRAAPDGPDLLDTVKTEAWPDMIANGAASAFTSNLDPNIAADAKIQQAAAGLGKAISAAVLKSKCHATGAHTEPNPTVPDATIATVDFTCTVPDATALYHFMRPPSLQQKITRAQALESMNKLTAALNTTTQQREASGQIKLFATPGVSGGHWLTGSPGGILPVVIDAISDGGRLGQ